MSAIQATPAPHDHVFLGAGHEQNERRTWFVIWLCGVMMVAEIIGGLLFGSIALVADGLHMSTHASALLLAALAYRYARRHADDRRFTFGTGKLGDLAGFTSAIVLAMIALLIGYEAVSRFIWPVAISFHEAIPIAALGLLVNIASVLVLSGGGHHHDGHGHAHHGDEQAQGAAARDNNMRAAIIHVLADAAVSMLVIVGLSFGLFFGWVWMDPVVGVVGAIVIAAWAYSLVRGTGAILLDMNPDGAMAERMRGVIEADGDRLSDLHLWRLGPGHLAAILSIATAKRRGPEHYRRLLDRFRGLSHVTVEVRPECACARAKARPELPPPAGRRES
jgi:cation diffusion facilitator family transporter